MANQNWFLGCTSERYESGGNGPGAINNYLKSNDYGGASYGVYQLASFLPLRMPNGNLRAKGVSPLMQYLNTSRFKERFTGLTPATPEFDARWKSVAKDYPDEFWADQHEYIKRRYYDVLVSNVMKEGVNLKEYGSAVQDLVWSTAVQLGPSNTRIFVDPLVGKEFLSDADVVRLVSQHKINNVGRLFKSSSSGIRQNVVNRWKSEERDLIALC